LNLIQLQLQRLTYKNDNLGLIIDNSIDQSFNFYYR
jgi:hypothetical protein